jgi:hypothetical protein
VWLFLTAGALQAPDLNPDSPTSILAAVIGLGALMMAGLLYDRRSKDRLIERLQEQITGLHDKVEARDAAATNRERQLGQEVFPMVKQMTDVLSSTIRSQVHSLEQHPPQTPGGLDPTQLRRIADALEAKP